MIVVACQCRGIRDGLLGSDNVLIHALQCVRVSRLHFEHTVLGEVIVDLVFAAQFTLRGAHAVLRLVLRQGRGDHAFEYLETVGCTWGLGQSLDVFGRLGAKITILSRGSRACKI